MVLAQKSPFFDPLESRFATPTRIKKVNFCTPIVLLCKFLAFFCHFFSSTPASVSTPNFQKSTPFENLALTFFSLPSPFSLKTNLIIYISTIYQNLSKFAYFQPKIFSRRIFKNLRGSSVHFRNKINKISENASSCVTAQS